MLLDTSQIIFIVQSCILNAGLCGILLKEHDLLVISFLYSFILYACMFYAQACHVPHAWGQKRVLESPELEFIDACVSPYWNWRSNLGPLEEQQGFLTADPFFLVPWITAMPPPNPWNRQKPIARSKLKK